MKIHEFCEKHGSRTRPIRTVMGEWQAAELHSLLGQAGDVVREQGPPLAGIAASIGEHSGSAVVIGDFLKGSTLLDQLPPDLRAALSELRKIDARDLVRMRSELLAHLSGGDGDHLPFDDPRVMGYINKIKGQIGENLFARHIGKAATLAPSGSQEGWDIAVRQADGSHEYVQVKLYKSPYGVVQHMRKVQEKISAGELEGVDQEQVTQVLFAVPEDIHGEVQRLAERFDGLSDMLYDKPIQVSSQRAADLVTEGMGNVGPDQLGHFFDELLGGCLVAGSLHGVVNGFLWYKGSKELSAAVADAAADSAVSSVGIGIALLAESAFDTAFMAGGVGMAARMFLKRAARSRWDFADFLKESLATTRTNVSALRS